MEILNSVKLCKFYKGILIPVYEGHTLRYIVPTSDTAAQLKNLSKEHKFYKENPLLPGPMLGPG